MPALFAFAVVAGHGKKRRRVLDLDPTNVGRLRHDVAGVLLHDLELEAFELGDFALEAGSFVFAAAPFAGALGRFTESSMVHEFLKDKPNRMAAGRAQRVASTRLYRKSVATVADALRTPSTCVATDQARGRSGFRKRFFGGQRLEGDRPAVLRQEQRQQRRTQPETNLHCGSPHRSTDLLTASKMSCARTPSASAR